MEINILAGLYPFDKALKQTPPGYHITTYSEAERMLAETKYHFDHETKEGVFAYPDGREVRLPAKGWMDIYGFAVFTGEEGNYWLIESEEVPSPSATHAWRLRFHKRGAYLASGDRGHGFSVCYIPNK